MKEKNKPAYIKHNTAMDIAFRVSERAACSGGVLFSGWWINMGFTKSWFIPCQFDPDYFIVPYSKLDQWSTTSNKTKLKSIRKCEWVRLGPREVV